MPMKLGKLCTLWYVMYSVMSAIIILWDCQSTADHIIDTLYSVAIYGAMHEAHLHGYCSAGNQFTSVAVLCCITTLKDNLGYLTTQEEKTLQYLKIICSAK